MEHSNLNYLNTEEKEILDTILTLYSPEFVNKPTSKHSKKLIDYILSDSKSIKLKNKFVIFTPPIIRNHSATVLLPELQLIDIVKPVKRTVYYRSKYLEKEVKTALTSID